MPYPLFAVLFALSQLPMGSLDHLPDPQALSAGPLTLNQPVIHQFSLSSGVRCVFVEDHALPVINGYAAFKVGLLEDPSHKAGLADMTSMLLRNGGSGGMSADRINLILEGLAAEVEFETGMEISSAKIHCFKADAEQVLSLFSRMLKEPRFEASRVELSRSQMVSAWERAQEQLLAFAAERFIRLIYNDRGAGNKATKASLLGITRPDIVAFHQQWYSLENMTMGLSGDLTLEEAKTLLERHLGGVPSKNPGMPTQTRRDEPTRAEPGIYFLEADGQGQSAVLAGMKGLKEADLESVALKVAFAVLGEGALGNRLFNTIRTQHGLAYFTGSTSNFRSTIEGYFLAYALTQPENSAEVLKLMREECRSISEKGITQEEWERARRTILNQEVFHGASSRNVMTSAVELSALGKPLNTRAMKIQKLQSLDRAQVNGAVRSRFRPESLRYLIQCDSALMGKNTFKSLGKVKALKAD